MSSKRLPGCLFYSIRVDKVFEIEFFIRGGVDPFLSYLIFDIRDSGITIEKFCRRNGLCASCSVDSTHFFFFFLLFPAFESAMATACFCGFFDFSSFFMLIETAFLELPLARGILYTTFKFPIRVDAIQPVLATVHSMVIPSPSAVESTDPVTPTVASLDIIFS